jgi:hypothetical protein
MIRNNIVLTIGLLAALAAGPGTASAAPKKAEPGIQLTEAGQQLEAKYAATLTAWQAEIAKALPAVLEQQKTALQKAREATIKGLMRLSYSHPIFLCRPADPKASAMNCNARYDNLIKHYLYCLKGWGGLRIPLS